MTFVYDKRSRGYFISVDPCQMFFLFYPYKYYFRHSEIFEHSIQPSGKRSRHVKRKNSMTSFSWINLYVMSIIYSHIVDVRWREILTHAQS